MKSLVSILVIKMLVPLFLIFSLYILMRGHNNPGGGFIGGLILGIILILYGMINGIDALKKLIIFNPTKFIGIGLFIMVISGLASLIQLSPFLTGIWSDLVFPLIEKPGTPIIFDVGVYVLVVGTVLRITVSLMST